MIRADAPAEEDALTPRKTATAQVTDRADTGDAIRVGLIGHGIQLSRTPKMHVEEGCALGLDYRYDLLDTGLMNDNPGIAALLDRAEADGFRGVNITHPFKQTATAHLHVLSDAARAVGAVNTVVFRDGRRYGHNTDYWGFAEAFRRAMPGAPTGHVLLLGAGGAGGAVAHALADLGARTLAIHDIDPARAARLADDVRAHRPTWDARAANGIETDLAEADGVVNATPVGMETLPGSPVPPNLLASRHWVADIVYFPLETEFLRAARATGCRTMDGSGMAVFQAVRAFELFSGVKPDPKRMRATFDAFTITSAGSSGT